MKICQNSNNLSLAEILHSSGNGKMLQHDNGSRLVLVLESF